MAGRMVITIALTPWIGTCHNLNQIRLGILKFIMNIKFLAVIILLLTGSCTWFYQPATLSLDVPDGPPEYKAGWYDGCRSRLSIKNTLPMLSFMTALLVVVFISMIRFINPLGVMGFCLATLTPVCL